MRKRRRNRETTKKRRKIDYEISRSWLLKAQGVSNELMGRLAAFSNNYYNKCNKLHEFFESDNDFANICIYVYEKIWNNVIKQVPWGIYTNNYKEELRINIVLDLIIRYLGLQLEKNLQNASSQVTTILESPLIKNVLDEIFVK